MTGFWTDRGWRIDRMMRQFRRWGGFGNETWPYGELPGASGKLIHDRGALEEDEVGLVAYIHSADTWTLLTSDRLVGTTSGTAFNIALREISEARPELLSTPEGRKGLIHP